jgi:hypothetical protein
VVTAFDIYAKSYTVTRKQKSICTPLSDDRKINVIGISAFSFDVGVLLVTLILNYKLSLSQMLSDIFIPIVIGRSWHTDKFDGFHDQETGLLAGVIGQQGMLIPPGHLITPPVYLGRGCPCLLMCFFLTCNSYLCFETDQKITNLHGKLPLSLKISCWPIALAISLISYDRFL